MVSKRFLAAMFVLFSLAASVSALNISYISSTPANDIIQNQNFAVVNVSLSENATSCRLFWNSVTPYAWVPDYTAGMLVRVDVRNGDLKNYSVGTQPQGGSTVDVYGNAWSTIFRGISRVNMTTGAISSFSLVTGLAQTRGIAADTLGNVWVGITQDTMQLKKVNATTGAVITNVVLPQDTHAVAIDTIGNVWTANINAPTISRINASNGNVTGSYTLPGNGNSLVADALGNVWVTTSVNKVSKINASNGNVTANITIVSTNAQGITADLLGNIWVGATKLSRINATSGEVTGNFTVIADTGVAADSIGNVWVSGGTTISKVNASNGNVTMNITTGLALFNVGSWGDMTGIGLKYFALAQPSSVMTIVNNSANSFAYLNKTGMNQSEYDQYYVTCTNSSGVSNLTSTNLITFDSLSPQWSSNRTNSTTAGVPAILSTLWTDGVSLANYTFEFDNGNGTLQNTSVGASVIGVSQWINVTQTLNSTDGSIIRWRVYVWDAGGLFNATSIFSFTGFENTAPQISFISPTPANNTNQSQNFAVVNVSLNENASGCILYWKNASLFVPNTMTVVNGSANTFAFFNKTSLMQGELNQYYATCNDSSISHNSNTTGTNWLKFDGVPPQWAQNQSNETIRAKLTKFSVYWTDTIALSNYTFEYDGGNGTLYNESAVSMTGLANWSNVTETLNSTIGSIIRWRIYARDGVGNINSTALFQFTVTKGIQSVSLTAPINSTYSWYEQPIQINFTITGAYGFYATNYTVDGVNYSLGAIPNATAQSFNMTHLQEGIHNFSLATTNNTDDSASVALFYFRIINGSVVRNFYDGSYISTQTFAGNEDKSTSFNIYKTSNISDASLNISWVSGNLTGLYILSAGGTFADWVMTGSMDNSTPTQAVTLNITALNAYLSTCTPTLGVCTVPITIHSNTTGSVSLDALKIIYYNNPLVTVASNKTDMYLGDAIFVTANISEKNTLRPYLNSLLVNFTVSISGLGIVGTQNNTPINSTGFANYSFFNTTVAGVYTVNATVFDPAGNVKTESSTDSFHTLDFALLQTDVHDIALSHYVGEVGTSTFNLSNMGNVTGTGIMCFITAFPAPISIAPANMTTAPGVNLTGGQYQIVTVNALFSSVGIYTYTVSCNGTALNTEVVTITSTVTALPVNPGGGGGGGGVQPVTQSFMTVTPYTFDISGQRIVNPLQAENNGCYTYRIKNEANDMMSVTLSFDPTETISNVSGTRYVFADIIKTDPASPFTIRPGIVQDIIVCVRSPISIEGVIETEMTITGTVAGNRDTSVIKIQAAQSISGLTGLFGFTSGNLFTQIFFVIVAILVIMFFYNIFIGKKRRVR